MKIILSANENDIVAISLTRGIACGWMRAHPDPATREEIQRVVESHGACGIPGLPGFAAKIVLVPQTAYLWISTQGELLMNCGLCWGANGSHELWDFLLALRADNFQVFPRRILPPMADRWIAQLVRHKGCMVQPEELQKLMEFLRNLFAVLEETHPGAS
jgi:hypothetical protein